MPFRLWQLDLLYGFGLVRTFPRGGQASLAMARVGPMVRVQPVACIIFSDMLVSYWSNGSYQTQPGHWPSAEAMALVSFGLPAGRPWAPVYDDVYSQLKARGVDKDIIIMTRLGQISQGCSLDWPLGPWVRLARLRVHGNTSWSPSGNTIYWREVHGAHPLKSFRDRHDRREREPPPKVLPGSYGFFWTDRVICVRKSSPHYCGCLIQPLRGLISSMRRCPLGFLLQPWSKS